MSSYRGRFAPSPTGPLHFGSLFAALVSYLDAKNNSGTWLLRIEDIDSLREAPGASTSIIRTLEAHHLIWDEEIVYQSTRSFQYDQLLKQLEAKEVVFRCPCSRKLLYENHGEHTDICKQQAHDISNYALKFRKNDTSYQWLDEFQGQQTVKLHDDFVLKRKEGFYAYQLAVVNDDYQQGITHVIRGYDLLESTPMQLALYAALDINPPIFSHFPVLCTNGQKLSKQNHAEAVDDGNAQNNIKLALSLLGLDTAAKEDNLSKMLRTAAELWKPSCLKGQQEIISPR